MSERMIFDTNSDPGIQVVVTGNGLSFSCEDDWCGSTETGFGATVSVELNRAQVARLFLSLGTWLKETDEGTAP